MNNNKPALQSKTLWINYLIFLGTLINELTPVIQDHSLTRTAMIVAIVNIVLRYVTKTGIGK